MKYFLVSHIGVQRGPSGQAKSQGRELHLPASGFCSRFPGSPLSAVAVMGTCTASRRATTRDGSQLSAGAGLRRVALLCLQDGSLKYAIQKTSRGKERRNVTPFYVIAGPGPR